MDEHTVQDQQADEREEYVRGLRELADFIEVTPDAPLPSKHGRGHDVFGTARGDLECAARVFGDEAQERASDYYVMISREFPGAVSLTVCVTRSAIAPKSVPAYEPILAVGDGAAEVLPGKRP